MDFTGFDGDAGDSKFFHKYPMCIIALCDIKIYGQRE